MFLVSGGWTGSDYIESTEIFDPDTRSWKAGAALPSPITALRAITIDNRVLFFGINNYKDVCREFMIIN